jgi:hypothetical protein
VAERLTVGDKDNEAETVRVNHADGV